jgi:uncharacterized protein (TIGR02302 family)
VARVFKPAPKLGPKAGLSRAAERRLHLARAALFYERLWPRTWGFLGVALVFCALSWLDLWHAIPGYLHALALIVFLGAAALALTRGLKGLRVPTREEALARLEVDSGFTHRPLQTLGDKLALGRADPASEALWRAHLERARAALERLRLKPPRPDIPRADPYALRVLFILVAFLALSVAGPDWRARLIAGLAPDLAPESAHDLTLDAWITPPAYTDAPAIFLARQAASPAPQITAPVGSVLTVRVTGVKRAPQLRRLARASPVPPDWHPRLPLAAEKQGAFKIDLPLEIDELVEVRAGRKTLNRWAIDLTPDLPPVIRLKEPLGVTPKQTLAIHYLATDDYGVATAEIRIEPAQSVATPAGDADTTLVVKTPLVVALALPPANGKSVDAKEFADLSASPLAGREVRLTLRASDEAGQTGESAPVTIRLPEREFSDPLARALIEQRRLLGEAPRTNRDHVRRALDALALAPERFTPDAVTYLGLRSAYFRLAAELDRPTVQSVYDLMWNLALHIEDGDLTLAENELRAAQKRLMDALAGGAPDDEIGQSMAALKRALQRYLEALAEAARQALARGETLPGVAPDGQVMTGEDLANMLKAIENMASTGARGQARQLLGQLQSLLENLQLGEGGAMNREESAMSQALKGLSDIIADERGILDETYRKSGQGGEARPGDRSANALARDQAELAERLAQLKGALEHAMPKGLEAFDQAGKAMGAAQDALAANQPGRAVAPETSAIEALQKGMAGLAQALAQSMGSRLAGENSEGSGRDPLGRRGIDQEGVTVPSEMALQRARKILEELQRRASDPSRQEKELEYLDRLLKRF